MRSKRPRRLLRPNPNLFKTPQPSASSPSHILHQPHPTHHESHNYITNYYHHVLSRMGRRHPDEAETKAGTSFSMFKCRGCYKSIYRAFLEEVQSLLPRR